MDFYHFKLKQSRLMHRAIRSLPNIVPIKISILIVYISSTPLYAHVPPTLSIVHLIPTSFQDHLPKSYPVFKAQLQVCLLQKPILTTPNRTP